MSEIFEKASSTVRFILAVAAGKGGVGKSTLTVNLALALQKKGWKVGILDADLYGPSLHKMLPPSFPASQNIQDPSRILPAIYQVGLKNEDEHQKIKMISLTFFYPDGEAAIVRAPKANNIIKQFLHSVDWAPLDCLLIDFPPGTGDIQLTLMQEGALSGALVVTTPQEVALLDVSKAIQMFDKMNIPIVGIVENMSYFKDPFSNMCHHPFGKDGGKRLAERQGIPFLAEIPIDPALSSCGDEGSSLFEVAPGSESCFAFERIAELVKGQLEAFTHLEGSYLKNFELIWKEGS